MLSGAINTEDSDLKTLQYNYLHSKNHPFHGRLQSVGVHNMIINFTI